KACEMAKKNARKNQLIVDVRQGDLLTSFMGEQADFVISNPPYLSKNELDQADPGVRGFEPPLALLGGERGTEFYERLCRDLPNYLRPGGAVFFEIGFRQGSAIQEIFRNFPWRRF